MQRDAAWNNVAGVIVHLQTVENPRVQTKDFSLSGSNRNIYFRQNYFQSQRPLDSNEPMYVHVVNSKIWYCFDREAATVARV